MFRKKRDPIYFTVLCFEKKQNCDWSTGTTRRYARNMNYLLNPPALAFLASRAVGLVALWNLENCTPAENKRTILLYHVVVTVVGTIVISVLWNTLRWRITAWVLSLLSFLQIAVLVVMMLTRGDILIGNKRELPHDSSKQ